MQLSIHGTNSPGPYSLGKSFIDSASISTAWKDTSNKITPSFIYIGEKNSILFSQSIDTSEEVIVTFETRFSGINKNYSLFQKRYLTEEEIRDTAVTLGTINKKVGLNELTVTGYKSVGVSAGNNGHLDLNQALEVKIFGKLSDKTTLSANLNDQGTTLEGDTREIGEIDLLFVKLDNPLFNIIVGDMYKNSIENGMLSQDKKIKGISAAFTGKKFGVSGYGAMSGGKYAVETFKGSLGIQGPFYLSGNGENDIINPVGGTVKVYLNGEKMKEGEEQDFIVDYDLGSISFTENQLINNNTTIRVEYEYKSFDYQRLFSGGDIYGNLMNSKLKFRGFIWHETDNKEYPLEIDLTNENIDSLKNSGDQLIKVSTGKKVDKNDVPSKSAKYHLYKDSIDVLSSDKFYVYHDYDPSKSVEDVKFYQVWFSQTDLGGGEYIIDTNYLNDIRGNVYKYVGAGNGTFTDKAPIPSPKRIIQGELITEFAPNKNINIKVDLAGEAFDKNTFSDLDDDDNKSSAVLTDIKIGEKKNYERSLWFKSNQKFHSSRFSRNVISYYEITKDWGVGYKDSVSTNIWEAYTGITPIPGISVYGGYGQFMQDTDISSHRGSYGLFLGKENRLEMNYNGSVLAPFDDKENSSTLRDSINIASFFNPVDIRLSANDEWEASDTGSGKIGAGLDIWLKNVDLKERFYFSQARKGGRSIFNPFDENSNDTGFTFIWDQKFKRQIRDGWNVSISSSYEKEKSVDIEGNSSEMSALLISAENKIRSLKQDASTSQTYRLSSERASYLEFVPGPYLGIGNGNYKKDSIDGIWEFDDKYGTHNGTFVELYDSTQVRKSSLKGSWHFNPDKKKVKGLLGDLKWKGSFSIDEHIADKVLTKFYSWIPGVTTIGSINDSAVTYSNVYYKQDIIWTPEFAKNFSMTFTMKPYLNDDRISKDGGFEGYVKSNKQWKKFTIENDLLGNLLNRNIYSNKDSIYIKDICLELLQRYYFISSFSMFARENLGLSERTTTYYDTTTSGPYFRLQPGFTLRLPKKGWAELSYIYSQVNLDPNAEYPMAQGFYNGTTHSIQFFIDIRAGERININGSYRGDFGDSTPDEKWLHLLSLEMKVML